jgi:hypothetical protein
VCMYAHTDFICLLLSSRTYNYISSNHVCETVFARSNTEIVGSNSTEAWMFVCVLCAFFLFLHSLK